MKAEHILLPNFKVYASFLLDKCIQELTQEDIRRSKELDLPLLKLFAHLSDTELFEVSKKGVTEYLESIVSGQAVRKILEGNENWKLDKIPGIPRNQIVASDIALIYNVRKHSLRYFLPRYTDDFNLAIRILDEIEDYYTFQEELAIITLAEINQEEITKRENRLKEAQELAKLGYWEYEIESNKVFWSDELYKIYGLDKEKEIISDIISRHIHPEDIATLAGKVQEIYKNGGTFVHEYRIRKANGQQRFLLDKAYVEDTLSGKRLVKGISQDITETRQAEQKLNDHDFFMKNMAEVAPFVITVYDFEENKTVYVNKNTYELLGYTDEEVKNLGLDIVNLTFHEDDAPNLKLLMKKVKEIKEFEIAELEYRVKDFDGNWKWLMSRASPFKRNSVGEVTQMLSITLDINEKKRSDEEIRRNENLLKEAQKISHLGSWEWNTVKNVVSWSDEMYRLFGYEPGEVSIDYETYLSHIYPEDAELVTANVNNCYQSGDPYTFEHRIISKDRKVKWLLSNGQVSQNNEGKVLALAGTAMDITEQKTFSDILKQKSEELQASNKELEAFCYTISHDLRSPLRAIDGFGRKLDKQYGHQLDSEAQRLLGIVRSNAQQMGVLIDSLLQFSRLNRKEMQKSKVEMEFLVENVIEELEQQFPDHAAEIKVTGLNDAPGDRDLLKQVWVNLISNAIKFSTQVAKPLIEIGCEKKRGQIIYYVKDNGAGFEMEYKDKLFGVFQRLHTQEEFAGTGVGLATVQRIIHRHGGSVWAEGAPQKGATFYFSLNTMQDIKEPSVTLN